MPRSRKVQLLQAGAKGLFLYMLVPFLILFFLARLIGDAVRASDANAFWIQLAALGAVCLNWAVYRVLRGKRPSLLVYAHGVCCLLATVIVEQESLPGSYSLVSTLAVIGGCLALIDLFLLSFWLASRRSRPAHTVAVGLWITIGVIGCFMAYRIIRDFEAGLVSRDTWITLAILLALIPAACVYRIRASLRGAAERRRATGLAEGRIVQIVGETHLDRDDDLVTDYHARVQYTVGGVPYETRAEITKFAVRKFGRKAFTGQDVPVRYQPADPARAFTDRIDRHFFDHRALPDPLSYQIVPATPEDADAVLRLYREQIGREFCFWNEDYPGPDTIAFDLSRNALFVMKKDDGSIIAAISVEVDEDVDRLECWTPSLRPAGEYARLAVSPAFQNRGLARQMVAHVLGVLKEQGFRSVHILVNRDNVSALRSYAHIGFRTVGECEMYGQHFLCYEKEL